MAAAHAPQDVDLEDKLIYGLSPLRFGYLVVALVSALTVWRWEALPLSARVPPCVLLTGAGVALAWGRWRGRALDRWLLDAVIFTRRNYRLRLPRPRRRRTVSLAAINALAGETSR